MAAAKTLTLMRHAKAVEAEPDGGDFGRPLAPRGRRAAEAVGRSTADQPPELVLCSSSRRTRETLDGLLAAWPQRPQLAFEDGLYLASPTSLLKRIETVPDGIATLWLVGHNPGIHELARLLARHGAAADRFPELRDHFPTAARAVFSSAAASWRDLAHAPLRLLDFAPPS